MVVLVPLAPHAVDIAAVINFLIIIHSVFHRYPFVPLVPSGVVKQSKWKGKERGGCARRSVQMCESVCAALAGGAFLASRSLDLVPACCPVGSSTSLRVAGPPFPFPVQSSTGDAGSLAAFSRHFSLCSEWYKFLLSH